MDKQLANTGSMLNKHMTNTESLQLDNITVTNNINFPVFKTTDVPSTPQNPAQGTTYIKHNMNPGPTEAT